MNKNFTRIGALILLVAWALAAMAQESEIVLPMVAGAAVPLYPPLARVARVEGAVHVKVTTDGHRVIATHVEDGSKLLGAAAEENVRTWQFATHDPTTFTVTYRYKLDPNLKGNPNNPTIVLKLPTEVEISTLPMPPLDAADSEETRGETRGQAGHHPAR
jgi:hypothetical protein